MSAQGIYLEFSVLMPPLPGHLRDLRFDPPLSDAELENFCGRNKAFRVERTRESVITIMTPVSMQISCLNAAVSSQLRNWFQIHRRGMALGSIAGYFLPDGSMMSPDSSYLTEETLAKVPRAERKHIPHICPDFVIELVSATDTLGTLQQKMQCWMESGVELGWLIEPEKERVFVYTIGVVNPVVVTSASVAGTRCVEGFRLDLNELWDWYRL